MCNNFKMKPLYSRTGKGIEIVVRVPDSYKKSQGVYYTDGPYEITVYENLITVLLLGKGMLWVPLSELVRLYEDEVDGLSNDFNEEEPLQSGDLLRKTPVGESRY